MASNDTDIPLSPAQRSRIRRLSQPKEAEAGEEAGELNVVPYLDIITNVMMFVLASVSVTFISSIDTSPPAINGKGVRDVTTKALNLTAIVTNEGIKLSTSGGGIGTGCQGVGSGITVPNNGADYDFVGLTNCAKALKNAREEFKEETQVTITANPGISYKTIIDVMDALRSDSDKELFPEVHFGVPR